MVRQHILRLSQADYWNETWDEQVDEAYEKDTEEHLGGVEQHAKDCECVACVVDMPGEPDMMQAWFPCCCFGDLRPSANSMISWSLDLQSKRSRCLPDENSAVIGW